MSVKHIPIALLFLVLAQSQLLRVAEVKIESKTKKIIKFCGFMKFRCFKMHFLAYQSFID